MLFSVIAFMAWAAASACLYQFWHWDGFGCFIIWIIGAIALSEMTKKRD